MDEDLLLDLLLYLDDDLDFTLDFLYVSLVDSHDGLWDLERDLCFLGDTDRFRDLPSKDLLLDLELENFLCLPELFLSLFKLLLCLLSTEAGDLLLEWYDCVESFTTGTISSSLSHEKLSFTFGLATPKFSLVLLFLPLSGDKEANL